MKAMPRSAQLYWWAIGLLGLGSLAASQVVDFPEAHYTFVELVIFIALAVVAGGKKVSLNKQRKDEEAGSMSLGFALTFAALLHFGPGSASLVAIAGCLSSCLFPKRQPFHQLGFNLGLGGIEAFVGGLVFAELNGWKINTNPLSGFLAVAGTSLAFFLINTLGVATMISFYTKENVGKLWKDNFLWTAPSYFASACVGAIAVLFFNTSASAVLLFVLPVAYLVYQSYVTYISRATEKQKHIEQLQQKQAELADLYLATIKSMALAIDAKDQYTHQHIVRVQRYAVAIAEQMGLDEHLLEAVRTGALLHDIGKLGVPEYVLLKPGRLTEDEFDKIKMHPSIGAAILEPVEFPWPVIPIVRHHHEKWDGTGYPDGLKGEDIPLTARIMAVADVYDALTSTRSYRQAWTHERTKAVIQKDAGTHFDPIVVEAFSEIIDRVVEEMAQEGTGPLVSRDVPEPGSECISKMAVEHISRTSTELWALYEVAQSLSSSLGTEDTIELLTRKIESIYPGSLCVFLTWDGKTQKLTASSAIGINQGYFVGAFAIEERSLSRKVLDTQEGYLGAFQPDDIMLSARPDLEWTGLQTAMIVPLYFNGNKLATINLYHSEQNAFTEYDKQLLELIAERAGQAIHNGLLFDRARGDSITDPLTGLHNLRYLTEYIDGLCKNSADDGSDEHTILCLDLDSFKPINDNFGHAQGDEVLIDIAHILREQVGPAGLAARCGGDEFVLVLKDTGRFEAELVAERIRQAIRGYVPAVEHPKFGALQIGASVGLACYPADGIDCAGLISSADHAMYAEKTEQRLRTIRRRAA